MKRRVLAICMAAALCVGLLPTTILAETGKTTEDAEESAEETDVQAADIEIGEDGTATIILDDAEEEETEEKVAEPEQLAEEEPAEEAEDEAEPEEVLYTAKSGSISVEVTAPYGALPEDAELEVERFAKDSEEYKDAAKAIGLEEDDTNMAALDISFMTDGEEVEPSEAVKVSIDASEILPEDADASSLEVQHLKEGRGGQVKAEVVANDSSATEGTIDEAKATAEFEIDSFSVFTVEWNDGTTDTIEVHVYNINGTSINETLDEPSTNIADNGTIRISELVNHLHNNSSLATEYTYQYATVIYETDLGGPGYSSDTLGGSNNSVTSISKSSTTYTVYFADGTTETVSDPALIKINLYYSTPTITLNTENPYAGTVNFTTSSEYFQHESEGTTTYAWALSNDSAGTLTHETAGEATFYWADTAVAGDQVTITVTKTVTYTDSEGDIQTEVASDTYTLTYGEDPITFTVTLNGTPQANAHVAIVDENGNTISTGITDENGQVTLYTVDGGTYTVGVTYCVADTSGIGGGSTSRYTAEGTVTLSDDGTIVTGDTIIALGTAIVSGPGGNTSGITGGLIDGAYYYEHIDVKVAAAGTEETQVSFSDLDAVYVYDKYGNLIYVSDDLERNPETGDYNCLFDINGSEDQHSIVVSSEDTIVIVYEVVDSDGNYSTYTAAYTGGGTYPSGEYYPYTAVNAYQLYNYINSTSYTEAQFEEMVANGTLTGNGIDISGMGYTEVADCLCDTRTVTGQAGLDFVIYVTEIEDVFGQYDFRVAKTLEGAPSTLTVDNIEEFTFELQDVSSVADVDTYTEGIWTTTGVSTTGSTSESSWTFDDDGNWNAVVDFANALTYTAEDGTYFYYFVLSEQDPTTATPTQQYYGLKFTVTYSSSTGVAVIVASYCDLTKETEDGTTYNRASAWRELTAQTDYDEESGEEYTYFSIPFINTYNTTGFELAKVDENGESLNGAVFTLATSDGMTLYFISSTDDDNNVVYTLADSDTGSADITVTDGGPVSIQGIAAGTYTLTETTAPTGYESIDSFTIEVAEDGTVSLTSGNENVTAEDSLVTVTNTPETTEISVVKEWVDNDNTYETRPNEISVQLLAGEEAYGEAVTLNEENSWAYKWEELPKYDSTGTEIEYTVQEISSIDGYETSYSDDTFTITNTLETVDVEGSKTWVDSENKYSTRTESITIHLLADGTELDSVKVTADDDWAWSFTDLPKYQAGSTTEVVYTIMEGAVPGYDTEVSGYNVTNTLETVDLAGSKVWENDSESERPDSITIHLYADGEEMMDIDGNEITTTATSDDDWAWSFKDLPKYQADGETEIVYTVLEGEISGSSYIPTYDVDENGDITITNAIPKVEKNVSDPVYGESPDDNLHQDEADNNDTLEYKMEADHIGGAHDLVLHDFLSDQLDMTTLEIQSVTLYTGEGDEGTALVEGTDYTVSYGECTADCGLEGCSFEIHVFDEDVENLSADAYVIVIFDIELKEGVEDFDNYVDEIDNYVGLSFTAFNVRTYAEPDETETYSYGFDLYKYDEDTEEPLEGVEFVISKDGDDGTVYAQFDVTDETYLLTAWVDSKDDATPIVTGSDGKAVIEGLHDGTFSIEETEAPEGYQKKVGTMTVTITVDEDDPKNPTITASNADVDGMEVQISNTPNSDETIEIIGSKTWADSNDADGIRPASITIHLFAGDDEVDSATVTAADDWAWSFKDLPVYDEYGEEITYTITEDPVEDYDTTVNNYNITNTHQVVTRDISGSKTWDDDDDKADARPASIKVNLYQNGDLYKTETVTEADGWAWSWTDLPMYDKDGNDFAYTIDEDDVEYYTPTYYDGNFNIKNTFVGEEGAEQPPTSGPDQGGDNPKTGDTSNLGVWLALLVAALACALVGLRMRRRR